MKKSIKKLINAFSFLFYTRNEKQIIEKISNKDFVCFDVFDTLIKRNVYDAKDIFKIVGVKHNNDTSFYNKRIQAEIKARQIKKGIEVTLDDIYSCIDYNDSDRISLKEMEIKTEFEYCINNYRFHNIYDYCVKNNKKIIIVSDMYLSKNIIGEILNNNGYKNIYRIYVSSDIGIKKSNGKIFKHILDQEKISSNNVIHIGDSFISDYLMPRHNGIQSILIKQKIKSTPFFGNEISKQNLMYNIIMSSINNIEFSKNDYCNIERECVEILTPLLYGFCNKLNDYLEQNDIEKIYFLARDAKIIHDAYLLLYPENNNKCRYVNLSRKSIIFASFSKNISIDEFINVAQPVINRKNIKEILEIIELDDTRIIEELRNNNIDMSLYLTDLDKIKKELFWNTIKIRFQAFCDNQKEYFKDYLIQNNFSGNVCLVDIGWKGTIQTKLKEYCLNNKIKANIFGYYMGIYNNKDNKKAFLYNAEESNKYFIYSSVGFFELLFLNNEGTTRYYELKNKIVVPVKGKYEQTEELTEMIINVHNNVKRIISNLSSINISINAKESFYNYEKIVKNPKMTFIKNLKNIKFNDGVLYNLIDDKSLFYYIVHPKQLKNNLLNSYYKIGFLKNLLFIRFPYCSLLEFVYKKIKNE